MFIVGLSNQIVKEKLPQEEDLTLEKAVALAKSSKRSRL